MKEAAMQKINELLKELEPLAADPKSADALDILSVFRSLRWEVQLLEESIMAIKFDKENN
jgi:CHASE3 domain sensor protein